MNISLANGRQATFSVVFGEPRFRILLVARAVAIIATMLRTVALSTLVFDQTGSPFLAALTFGIAYLPQVLGGLLLGSLSDQLAPRTLISAGYLAETLLGLGLGLLAPSAWLCLLMVATVSCLTPVCTGASSRLVAEVLFGDAYVVGRSLWNSVSSAGQLLGFAAGGITIAAFGTRSALLTCAALDVGAALIVRLAMPRIGSRKTAGASVVRHSLSGSRFLLRQTAIRRLFWAQWLPPACVTTAEAMIVAYSAQRHFPRSAAGPLLACIPLGMLIGNVIVGRFVSATRRERLVLPLMMLLGAPLLAILLNPPLAILGTLLVLTGCGFAYGLGIQRQFLDALASSRRGQAFGLLSTGLQTLQGLGPAIGGLLAEPLAAGTVMAITGGCVIFTASWLAAAPHTPRVNRAAHSQLTIDS